MMVIRLTLWILGLFLVVTLVAGISIQEQITAEEMKMVKGDPKVTHKIVFKINRFNREDRSVEEIGDIHIALFGETVPKTVNNFVELSRGTKGFGYGQSIFHRIIKDFMVQGGDFENSNGSGGFSIYGKSFADENFELKHDKLGRLSMANAGPNTNGAQFFITTRKDCGWLNGHHVVFGQVVNGFDTLMEMNIADTNKDSKPFRDIYIKEIFAFDIRTDEATGETSYQPIRLPPTSYYGLLFISLLVIAGWYFAKWHFKNQRLTDIRENIDYF